MRPASRLLLVLLVPALASACSGSGGAAATFSPPPASAFRGGPCELVADDLVVLGRQSVTLTGTPAPDQPAKDALKSAQERVQAVAETAPAPVRAALDEVVLRAGAARLQADTRRLDAGTLDGLHSAYLAAVAACTGASPSPGSSAG